MRKVILITMVASVFIMVGVFMIADRAPPHTYELADIFPDKAVPGEAVTLILKLQRSRDCPGTVYRSLVYSNGHVHNYDVLVAAIGPQVTYDKGEQSSASFPRPAQVIRQFNLPRDHPDYKIPRGPVRYRAVVHYYCNIMHQLLRWPIIVEAPEIPFEIVDASP